MLDKIKTKINLLKEKAGNLSVLYVEDELELRQGISSFLNKIFTNIDTASNGLEGLEKYTNKEYDIVITDIQMPKMNGLEMIKKIKEIKKQQEIIVVSAYTDSIYFTESISLGVTGYIIKPIDFPQILKMLDQSIYKLSAFRENEMYKVNLETMVKERTQTILTLQNEKIQNYQHAIQSLVKMMEARDTYTGGHSQRVAEYSKDIAQVMGLTLAECNMIYESGILHDIGKIVTPDAILLKPNSLTQDEYSLIKDHVTVGYNILNEIPMYKELADIVHAHHEHYDGSGYPKGLDGDSIPILSRILAVADAFDAMTTQRVYKPRKTISQAIQELEKYSDSWYDPKVIQSATEVFKFVDLKNNAKQLPSTFIDDERFAYFYKDPLTHLYNHYYLDFILQSQRDSKKELYLNVVYIRGFSRYNKKHGWSEGDIILRDFSDYLRKKYHSYQLFRIFGDDFVLLSEEDFELDVNKINSLALFEANSLSCSSRYINLQKTNIHSFKDLQ
ncbi:HD domain-containing phosphohydrolase [Sulfurimonas sp.]|uniref:HD domain-containing phosphohydrolase n=1 Tax=Sulfurimonas sp. TaxID=2022749 RepID=UPI0025CD843A|nr:HD domain-containing phosphohydrolase [Sulfurimonas sp.]